MEEEFNFSSNLMMKKRSWIKDKSGMTIKDLYPIMLIFVLVAILITIVLYILSSVGTNMAIIDFSVVNETEGSATATGYSLAQLSSHCNPNTIALTAVWSNETALSGGGYNLSVPVGNLSVSEFGVVTNATPSSYTNLSISYTFKSGGVTGTNQAAACDSTLTIVTQIVNFIPWLGIILLVVAAAITIGVLISSFRGNRRV